MTRKFIISIEHSTKESDLKFLEFLKSHGCSWWSWINNTWLITDPQNVLTSELIGKKINEFYYKTRYIVNQVDVKDWYAYGPLEQPGENISFFPWLRDYWL